MPFSRATTLLMTSSSTVLFAYVQYTLGKLSVSMASGVYLGHGQPAPTDELCR